MVPETPYPDLANGIRPLDGSQYGTPTPYPGLSNGIIPLTSSSSIYGILQILPTVLTTDGSQYGTPTPYPGLY